MSFYEAKTKEQAIAAVKSHNRIFSSETIDKNYHPLQYAVDNGLPEVAEVYYRELSLGDAVITGTCAAYRKHTDSIIFLNTIGINLQHCYHIAFETNNVRLINFLDAIGLKQCSRCLYIQETLKLELN